MLSENCFIPLIKKPTRFNANSGSLIDHIWTNVSLDKSICAAIITHPLSDHLPLFLSYANSIDSQSKLKMQRFFSSAKTTLFNNELQKVNIDPVLKETDPDISFKVLLKDYMNLLTNTFQNRLSKTIERIIIGLMMSSKNYCPTKKHYLRNTCKQNPLKQKDSLQKLVIFILERFNKKNKNTLKINWNLIKTT